MKHKKVLIITNKMVFPSTDGGSVAMQDLANILTTQKYNLDIVTISKKINRKIISLTFIILTLKQLTYTLFFWLRLF